MTISYVSGATAEATTLTMPSHQKGDLILAFAFNSTVGTALALPSGWSVAVARSSVLSSVCGFKYAANSSESFGTWTGATMVAVAVYRHDVNLLMVGGANHTSAVSTSINYQPITTAFSTGLNLMRVRGGADAFVVGFVGVNSSATNAETAPIGMTNRISLAGTNREIGVHDTNGNVSNWALTTFTANASSTYHTLVLEIFDSGCPKSSASIRHALSQQVIG